MKKILIVDDDKEWNFLLKMVLSKAGFSVSQAFNGKEGLDKIAGEKPDLILLDITMPVMDGWEVCKNLKENPETKNIPVLILSSYTSPSDIQLGKDHQVKRYIIKPCLPEAVIQNVRDVFNQESG